MPDAKFLHHSLQTHHLYCIIFQALNTNISVANHAEAGFKGNAISSLYSKCITFQAAWVCGQSYASNSHIPPKCT